MGSVSHHWLQEGIKKGRKTEKITTAKKMSVKNKPLNTIIDFTGLTKKEIEKLG